MFLIKIFLGQNRIFGVKYLGFLLCDPQISRLFEKFPNIWGPKIGAFQKICLCDPNLRDI